MTSRIAPNEFAPEVERDEAKTLNTSAQSEEIELVNEKKTDWKLQLAKDAKELKLDVQKSQIDQVAGFHTFDDQSLNLIKGLEHISRKAVFRQGMVDVLDLHKAAKIASVNTASDLMRSGVDPKEFVLEVLMPSESIVAGPLDYRSISIREMNNEGHENGNVRSLDRGMVFLTNQRLLIVPQHKKVEAELSLQELSEVEKKSAKVKSLMKKIESARPSVLKRVLRVLKSLGYLLACPTSACSDKETWETLKGCGGKGANPDMVQQLETDLNLLMQMDETSGKKALLVEILSLLQPPRCCPRCDCKIKCVLCSVFCDRTPFTLEVLRSEEFGVLPIPLDRFTHAEINSNIISYAYAPLEKQVTCGCCAMCASESWGENKKQVKKEKPKTLVENDRVITMGVFMPPWGKQHIIKICVKDGVEFITVSGFLAKFYSLQTFFPIQTIGENGKYTVNTRGTNTAGVGSQGNTGQVPVQQKMQ